MCIHDANFHCWFGKHWIAYLVTMTALCTVECHLLEYEIREVEMSCVAAFGAGKWDPAKAHVRVCGSDPVH